MRYWKYVGGIDKYADSYFCNGRIYKENDDGYIVGSDDMLWDAEIDFKKGSFIETKEDFKTLTIQVSPNGATLSDGENETEVVRYSTDEHNERIAVEEVVNKYFNELSKIKVGDKVEVINVGSVCSAYGEFFIENNVSIGTALKWNNGKIPSNEKDFTVTMIKDEVRRIVALIENSTSSFVVDIKGLKKI